MRSARKPVWTRLLPWLLALGVQATNVGAQSDEKVPRHAEETRALTAPENVLEELPAKITKARDAGDFREVALLRLAEANACRVLSHLACQRDAGRLAREAAQTAADSDLQVRGLIMEASGEIALQDFVAAERLLGEAERLLQIEPHSLLASGVYLSYSGISYSLGRYARARDFAARGLVALGDTPAPVNRVRLLRNQARGMIQLNDVEPAVAVLQQALALLPEGADPKLRAELHVEMARVAHARHDADTLHQHAERTLALATQLNNRQLRGMAHELLGTAATDKGDVETAERELRFALESFRELELRRDERRVLRQLLRMLFDADRSADDLPALVNRLVNLESALEAEDQATAADNFESRLAYAQQEFEVGMLKQSVALAEQRQRLSTVLIFVGVGLVVFLAGAIWLQRRYSVRLDVALRRARESESRYRMLAENSRDLVVRLRSDGQPLYVAPSAREVLGLEPEELTGPQGNSVHPDDRQRLAEMIASLEHAPMASLVYRARHREGHDVWIEALARTVPSEHGGPADIVYSGRDVSERVRAERALQESEHRLRALTDNIPAAIAQIDTQERFVEANPFLAQSVGKDPAAIVGRTLAEVLGDAIYQQFKPHVEEALRGNVVRFASSGPSLGKVRYYNCVLVPEWSADGGVRGLYTFNFDVTELTNTKAELERLARIDSLTNIANRRHFEERLDSTLAHARRSGRGVALLEMDLDRFKKINDTYGHPVGDEVLREFVRRVLGCVRKDDFFARLGGDEFVLLVEEPPVIAGEVIANKLLRAMDAPFVIDSLTLTVTSSIGAAYGTGHHSPGYLLELADQALYEAKANGRATFAVRRGEPPASGDSQV